MNFIKIINSNKIIPIVISIGIIYLTYLVSDIFWIFLTPENKEINNKIVVSQIKKNNTLPLNIFGKEKKVVKKTYKKVVKTRLSLILVGVINKKPAPVAIIQFVNGGVDKVYKVGDEINSNATLKDIGDTFVIIDHNGKDEKLSLKFKINKDIQESKEAPVVSTANKDAKIIKLGNNNKSKLKNYLINMSHNPASALAIVSVKPNFISGLLNGFIISPSKERKLFEQMGFKKDDIIIEINDIQLNSLSKAFKIGKELSKQRIFDFVILRNNAEQYIHLDLN
jgi:general secretion pathway protein C